ALQTSSCRASSYSTGALVTGQTRMLSSFLSIMGATNLGSVIWSDRDRPGGGHWRCYQLGIEAHIKPVDAPIQMRTAGAPGRADLGHFLTDPHAIALFYQQPAQMHEGRRHPEAVIHDQRAAGEKQVRLRQRHHRIGRRSHPSTHRRCHIDAVMRAPRLAVINALAAVDAADATCQRPLKAVEKTQ